MVDRNTSTTAWLVATPIVAIAILRIVSGGPPTFPTDDTYISQHAARFLTSAEDPSYEGSAPLVGATSLLHVTALWATMRVLSPSWAVEMVTWLGGILYLVAIVRIVTSRTAVVWHRWALLLVGTGAGSATMHLTSGQETGWAMAAVAWSIYWLQTDEPPRSRLAWMAGWLPWLRPDLGLLSLGLWYYRIFVTRSRWLRDSLIVAGSGFLGMWIYWQLTGHLLPNTIEAKRQFFAYYSRPLWLNTLVAGVFLTSWIARVGPSVMGIALSLRHQTDRIVGWAFAGLLAGLAVSGPNVIEHNFFRYLQPLSVPLMVAGLCQLKFRSGAAWLALCGLWTAFCLPVTALDWMLSQRIVVDGQQSVASWLSSNARPGSVVLVHDAGLLSEYTNMSLTDLVGLKTPRATEWHRRLTGPSQGERRAEAVHRLACETSPQYYVAFNGWEKVFGLTDGLTEFGWDPKPLHHYRVPRPKGDLVFTVYYLTRSDSCPQPALRARIHSAMVPHP
jgi:hypothetical protein